MKSEEYFIELDTIKHRINQVLEKMDNEDVNALDTMTHEIIYLANKWRSKNDLPRYKELDE